MSEQNKQSKGPSKPQQAPRANSGNAKQTAKQAEATNKSVIDGYDNFSNQEKEPRQAASSPKNLQLFLAQYNSLREEIIKRIELQHQLIALTLAAAGTILAVGVQNKNAPLVLLYPTLAMFLSAAWMHNQKRVHQIGAFIRARIEPPTPESKQIIWWEQFRVTPTGKIGNWELLSSRGIFLGTELLGIFVGAYIAGLNPFSGRMVFEDFFQGLDPLVKALLIISLLSALMTLLLLIRNPSYDFRKPAERANPRTKAFTD